MLLSVAADAHGVHVHAAHVLVRLFNQFLSVLPAAPAIVVAKTYTYVVRR